MKYVVFIVFAAVLTSCGAAYDANQAEKGLKGNWVLEYVSFPDSSGFFDVKLFNLADVACFENSQWRFIPNNSSGTFTLDGNNCDKTEQQFTWYIDSETANSPNPELLLKLTTGQKARTVNQGSRIKIKSLLAERMVWEENVMFKGNAIQLQMTFIKL